VRSWKEALVFSKLMASFLKRSKVNAAECFNSSENKLENHGCQPIILKDEKEVG